MDETFYKGFTTDYQKRLSQHNRGESRYTSKKTPWKLVYVEQCTDKKSALKREKSLKRTNSEYLSLLIHQPTNLIKQQ